MGTYSIINCLGECVATFPCWGDAECYLFDHPTEASEDDWQIERDPD